MHQQFYQKFLSGGFAELNAKSREHIIKLYRHNYQKLLPRNKQAKVLEIGCGMGVFLEFMGRLGYEDLLGVDISPEAVEFCLERGVKKVRLINDLAEFLNMCGMYDLIVLNDVIEHFPKQEVLPILNKTFEKLLAGGLIIVKTGNLASLAGPKIRYNDFTHETGFTEYSLAQVLKVSGFRDIMVSPFIFPKNSATRVVRFLVQKVIHAAWKAFFFFEFTGVPKIVDELIFAVGKK